jgi:hypothetical protein
MSRIITDLSDPRPNKAPIVQVDRNQLGDKRLDPTENLAKLREGNEKLSARSRIPHQEIFEHKGMALGIPMASNDLIRLLKKMAPALIIEDGGVRNAVAVRVGPVLLEDGTIGKRYLTGFYKGTLPEFSCIFSDERGRPTREDRGWRTVVLNLIKQGVVSYKDAVDVFGEPSGVRAGRWQEILRAKRA